MENARRMLRTPQAAEYLGLAKGTLEKFRVDGIGPPFLKIGRVVSYDIHDLDSWIEERKMRKEQTIKSG